MFFGLKDAFGSTCVLLVGCLFLWSFHVVGVWDVWALKPAQPG